MLRATRSGAAARRGPLAIWVAAALAGAAVWLVWWTVASPAGDTMGWLLAVGCAAVAGHALGRGRGDAALREARDAARLVEQTTGAWLWRTDAEHRLVRFEPPPHAPAQAWATAPPPAPLWERFEAADGAPGSLRARLQAEAPLVGLAVSTVGGTPARWTLDGLARYDAAGRFAGYVGSARSLDAEDACRADRAALDALLRTLPGAVWFGRRGVDGGWTVSRCNDAAARRHAGAGAGAPWDRVAAALPGDLQRAFATLEPGASARGAGWTLRLEPFDTGGEAGRLLVLEPAAGDDGAEHAQFSYTVSHDLRAPLRVVEGFARIVKEDYARVLDRIGIDHLDRVLAAAARMHHMIDAMLVLAQLSSQPLARQPVDLSQLAGFVVDELRRQAPERVADVKIEPGLVVHGDPTLLRLVLENLLGNAWKYSAKTPRAQIGFGASVQDGRTVFVVRDNGAGFDMRFADRLFAAFQRLHSANDFAGTGVGLASVKRIVRRHGGDVWAEGDVGRGARFYFTLGA